MVHASCKDSILAGCLQIIVREALLPYNYVAGLKLSLGDQSVGKRGRYLKHDTELAHVELSPA
jgi:hypothetical protein